MIAVVLLSSSLAAAQAWVNPKGEIDLALRSDFQESQGVWHGALLITGLPVYAFNDSLSVEYVPIEKLALGIGINGNDIAYEGPQSIPNLPYPLAHGRDDDGSFHANLTDLDFTALYEAYNGAFTFTPVLRGRVPITDYENKGYAAAGSHLAEAGIGFYLGKYGLGSPDLIVQLGYTFTYVAKDTASAETEQYRVNRSDADLIVSYIFTRKLIAGVGAAFRYTHDGFDLGDYASLPLTSTLIQYHDAVLKAEYFAPLAVATYELTPAWSLGLHVAAIVWGRSVSNAISSGLTLSYTNNLLD